MAALQWHPATHVPTEPAPDLHARTHRSRVALESVLRNPDDEQAWASLYEFYDESAEDWDEWVATQPWYVAPVVAGLIHAKPADLVVEVSCGSAQATPLLDAFAPVVLATDTSTAMLAEASRALTHTTYARVDVRRMPLRSGSVPLLVALNGVPHPGEFARVLTAAGQLLWCTSFGAGTPLYVQPQRLLDLMGPAWRGEAGRAGHGEWLLLTRVR